MSTTIINVHQSNISDSTLDRFAVCDGLICRESLFCLWPLRFVFGIAILAIGVVQPLAAAKLGFLSLTPELQATATYNSNINTSATNALDDFIVNVGSSLVAIGP